MSLPPEIIKRNIQWSNKINNLFLKILLFYQSKFPEKKANDFD